MSENDPTWKSPVAWAAALDGAICTYRAWNTHRRVQESVVERRDHGSNTSAICNRRDSEARIMTGAIEMGNRSGERTDAKKRVKCKDNPCNLYRGETRMRAIPSIYVECSP